MIKPILLLTSLLIISPVPHFIEPLPSQAQQSSGWQQFFRRIVPRSPLPRKRGGGRTGLFGWEIISPGIWSKSLWTLEPNLIWQFNRNAKQLPDRVEILQLGSSTPLWTQPIQRHSSRTIPITAKLEPGRTYFVRFLRRNADLQKDEVIIAWEFKTLSIAQRQKVTAELDRPDKTLNPSERLQRRLEVFAKYELWSDAFQEIERSNVSVNDDPAGGTASQRQTVMDSLLAQLQTVEPSRPSSPGGIKP